MRQSIHTPASRLDARAPLVIDTRELARRPGTMRTVSRSVPAPAHLGVDVLGVAEGSRVQLELRLESVMEGVLVSGSAQAQVHGECVRCLDPISSSLVVEMQELFAYPGGERDVGHDEGDLPELDGDLLDLEPVLRDAVVLALPLQPRCRDDCPGLCPECGERLADAPGHSHPSTDPRWAALTTLTPMARSEPSAASERTEEI